MTCYIVISVRIINRDRLQITAYKGQTKYTVTLSHTETGVARHERESEEEPGAKMQLLIAR